MSHQRERKEKDCLNCGAQVAGRYCQQCGQENIVTKQNFWSFVTHFVFDLFHFDGKFFDTVSPLLLKPGYVAREYVTGKRVRFLDPVRMYLFTSALFFLIFFIIVKPEPVNVKENTYSGRLNSRQRLDITAALYKTDTTDAYTRRVMDLMLDSSQTIVLVPDTTQRKDSILHFNNQRYRVYHESGADRARNDSAATNNWLGRLIQKKARQLGDENPDDPANGYISFLESLMHKLPYLLFLSLPFFALILKLVYVRKKQFYYTDHVIFTLYHYIFSFIILLLIIGIGELNKKYSLTIFTVLEVAFILYWFYYLYKGMRRFYGQGRWKTIIKFLILNLVGFLLLIVLVTGFLLYAAIDI